MHTNCPLKQLKQETPKIIKPIAGHISMYCVFLQYEYVYRDIIYPV